MAYSVTTKVKAATLRKKGFSLGDISRNLKVSKATLSLWLRELNLDRKAKKRLIIKIQTAQKRGRNTIKEKEKVCSSNLNKEHTKILKRLGLVRN
ncbi:MAG: hypothetical protein ACOX6V_03135 [Patescibacteria group bacterium]|jgi:orotate phosphoribosyltransferase-like protein